MAGCHCCVITDPGDKNLVRTETKNPSAGKGHEDEIDFVVGNDPL